MVTLSYIEEQLKRAGCNFRWWGRPEIRELANIIMPDEIIFGCVNGRYEGGFALLTVTNHRMLLIDRKPMFLTLEDLRFDMISELDYSARLMESTVVVMTPNRKLIFSSWGQRRLRKMLNYTQQRVMEVRQHYMAQQFQAQQQPQTAPLVGGLAMQGTNAAQWVQPMPIQFNPYNHVPVTIRNRNYPGFF